MLRVTRRLPTSAGGFHERPDLSRGVGRRHMKRRTRKKWASRDWHHDRQGDVWWQGHHLRWTAEASPHGKYGGYKWPSSKPLPDGTLLMLFGPPTSEPRRGEKRGGSLVKGFEAMKPSERAALEWLFGSGDTGSSSIAICCFMLLGRTYQSWGPADFGDFGRCHRLLERVPRFRRRLHEMASVGGEWAELIPAWDELTALYLANRPDALFARLRELTGTRPSAVLRIDVAAGVLDGDKQKRSTPLKGGR